MSCSTGSSSRFNAIGERHNADIHAFIDGIEEVKDRLTKARVRTHTQALLTGMPTIIILCRCQIYLLSSLGGLINSMCVSGPRTSSYFPFQQSARTHRRNSRLIRFDNAQVRADLVISFIPKKTSL